MCGKLLEKDDPARITQELFFTYFSFSVHFFFLSWFPLNQKPLAHVTFGRFCISFDGIFWTECWGLGASFENWFQNSPLKLSIETESEQNTVDYFPTEGDSTCFALPHFFVTRFWLPTRENNSGSTRDRDLLLLRQMRTKGGRVFRLRRTCTSSCDCRHLDWVSQAMRLTVVPRLAVRLALRNQVVRGRRRSSHVVFTFVESLDVCRDFMRSQRRRIVWSGEPQSWDVRQTARWHLAFLLSFPSPQRSANLKK